MCPLSFSQIILPAPLLAFACPPLSAVVDSKGGGQESRGDRSFPILSPALQTAHGSPASKVRSPIGPENRRQISLS